MNIDLIEKNLSSYIPLDPTVFDMFLEKLEPVEVPNRDFLVRLGDKTDSLHLVNSGCFVTYYIDPNGNKHVLQFAMPMWWTGDIDAFINERGPVYETQAMENSLALRIRKKNFDNLLEQAPVFERYFRIIFQNSLVTHQRRIIQNIAFTAENRYKRFVKKYPVLEQQVPQKLIASYLGITPEFLSKIRRNRKNMR